MKTRKLVIVPPPIAIFSTFAMLLILLPFIGLAQRTPWNSFFSILSEASVRSAISLSLLVATVSAFICLLLGLPLGWILARSQSSWIRLLRAIVLLPMVLPPVAGGTALLFALGRRGFVGQKLDQWFSITLPFTTAGAIVAATFVSLPFFILAIEASIKDIDSDYEESAMSLGSSPTRTFFSITIPLIRTGLITGLTLSWARALGEFGATITFAGDNPGRTRTLPLELFVALESDPNRAVVIGMIMVSISLGVLITLRGRWIGQK